MFVQSVTLDTSPFLNQIKLIFKPIKNPQIFKSALQLLVVRLQLGLKGSVGPENLLKNNFSIKLPANVLVGVRNLFDILKEFIPNFFPFILPPTTASARPASTRCATASARASRCRQCTRGGC